jgi:hypothetical protein
VGGKGLSIPRNENKLYARYNAISKIVTKGGSDRRSIILCILKTTLDIHSDT